MIETTNEIIELVENCKLVKIGSEENGHDYWGNYESSSYKYVLINNKEERCWDGWYVIHDGKNVKDIISEYIKKIRDEEKAHFERTGFKTPREYQAYLMGKNNK